MINYNMNNDILNNYFATVTDKFFANSGDFEIYEAMLEALLDGKTNDFITSKNYTEVLDLPTEMTFEELLAAAERIKKMTLTIVAFGQVIREPLLPLECESLTYSGVDFGKAIRLNGIPAVCKKNDILYFISDDPIGASAENVKIENYLLKRIAINTGDEFDNCDIADICKACGVEPTKENTERIQGKVIKIMEYYIENGLVDDFKYNV